MQRAKLFPQAMFDLGQFYLGHYRLRPGSFFLCGCVVCVCCVVLCVRRVGARRVGAQEWRARGVRAQRAQRGEGPKGGWGANPEIVGGRPKGGGSRTVGAGGVVAQT